MSNDNFANYFADTSISSLRAGFEKGETIKAKISGITHNSIFLDVNYHTDGILSTDELTEEELENLKPDDEIEVFYVGQIKGETVFSVKISGEVSSSQIETARDASLPIEGLVEEERKGGFSIQLADKKAFCPFSQIDIYKKESSEYIGNKYLFYVTEYTSDNLVVSRKAYLQEERDKKIETIKVDLKEGDILDGVVTKIMDFGAFVSINNTFEGLIPISELAWWRVASVSDIVSEGDTVKVKVKSLDWENDKISFSLRETLKSPWDTAEDKYIIGKAYTGKVTKLMIFGAFVQLELGLEGLVHISKLGAGRRINHPKEVVKEGDTVEATIESIDIDAKRISLSMDNTLGKVAKDDNKSANYAKTASLDNVEICEGGKYKGRVDGIKDFGIFVKLSSDKSGLLHISQINFEKRPANPYKALSDRFPEGSELEVVIKEINANKISLTLAETIEREKEMAKMNSDFSDSKSSDFGALGDLFSGLKL